MLVIASGLSDYYVATAAILLKSHAFIEGDLFVVMPGGNVNRSAGDARVTKAHCDPGKSDRSILKQDVGSVDIDVSFPLRHRNLCPPGAPRGRVGPCPLPGDP